MRTNLIIGGALIALAARAVHAQDAPDRQGPGPGATGPAKVDTIITVEESTPPTTAPPVTTPTTTTRVIVSPSATVLVPVPMPAPVVVVEREPRVAPWGMSVSAGVGVTDFAGSDVRGMTGSAGSWDARLGLGTRQMLGFEAAYLGSAQSIDAMGLDSSAILVSNGLEAIVRANLLPGAVQPYAFGGVAWRRYAIMNTDVNASGVSDGDDVVEVPFGVGLGLRASALVFDARVAYRVATGEDLVASAGTSSSASSLDTVSVAAHVGVEF